VPSSSRALGGDGLPGFQVHRYDQAGHSKNESHPLLKLFNIQWCASVGPAAVGDPRFPPAKVPPQQTSDQRGGEGGTPRARPAGVRLSAATGSTRVGMGYLQRRGDGQQAPRQATTGLEGRGETRGSSFTLRLATPALDMRALPRSRPRVHRRAASSRSIPQAPPAPYVRLGSKFSLRFAANLRQPDYVAWAVQRQASAIRLQRQCPKASRGEQKPSVVTSTGGRVTSRYRATLAKEGGSGRQEGKSPTRI